MKGAEGYSDSDEDQHDAYLERMKEEGKIREEGDGSDESEGDSGTDTPPLKHTAHTKHIEHLPLFLVGKITRFLSLTAEQSVFIDGAHSSKRPLL